MAPAALAADLALVIGNHDYRNAPDALSARADARAIAQALEQGGYEVIAGTDLTRSEMRRQVARFAERLGDADRVVVYYSGHALRTGGASYLAPVDQNNATLVEVMMDGVPLELVLRLAGAASGGAVVFVDGAQLDGFTPRDFAEPGLAHIDPPGGVLVVSAAAPGRAIARRSESQSAFAQQVVREFLTPGANVGRAVRRLGSPAWVGGDTDSSLVLVPEGRVRPPAEAETRPPAAAQVESRLNLSASERRNVQESLNRLGYNTRGTDGIFGPGTRSAIRGWQRANDLTVTGYMTREQVALVKLQAQQRRSDTDTSPAAQVEARLNLSRSERSEIQQRLSNLGYDTRGTGGTFGTGTRSAIRNWQRANELQATGYLTAEQVALITLQARERDTGTSESAAAQVESRLNLTGAERSDIQERLSHLGYDTRGTGGTFGAGTRSAIRDWQRANNLLATGYLTAEQVALIREQSSRPGTDPGQPTAADVEAGLNLTRSERSEIQDRLSFLGYDTRGTDGLFGSGTRTAIRNWQRANGFEETGYLTQQQLSRIYQQTSQGGPPADTAPSDPAAAEAALGLTRNDRLSIEQRLAFLGFPPGPQDGFFDGDTRRAIEGYQGSRGHAPTGYLDRRTVANIVQETSDVRTGIVTGAEVLMEILRGLGDR
ncbi:MAG TPA: peptidoglycan-binding protein [Thermohalobaculum sp.]|nr:peptidoglycan-binding protein [Thermohalobaculum sp.]